jgi:hypothetical protein
VWKLYYMVQMSYHSHSLLWQLTMTARNDFVEMVLHHCCALFLVGFSYSANFMRIGVLVLVVHDVGDVVGYAIKVTTRRACACTLVAPRSVVWTPK